MHWDAYTVFSVISGAILLLGALAAPGVSIGDRLKLAAAGVFFGGYGIYVASQTSGTFYFSVVIFIIPFGALAYIAYLVHEARQRVTAP